MTSAESVWWVYIIETDKGALYTGITTDVARRFAEHLATNEGRGKKGARFFRSQRPLRVAYQEPHESRSAASVREAAIKRLNAAQKHTICVAFSI